MQHVGNYLSNTEVQELVSGFKKKSKFQHLLTEMNQYERFTFNEKEVEVKLAIAFDVKYNDIVTSAKAINLQVSDNIGIQFITRYKDGNKDNEDNFFWGTITQEEYSGNVKTKHFKAYTNTLISSFDSEWTEESIIEAEKVDAQVKEDFPIDENYYPGMLIDQVETKGMLDGCLPPDYIWCGQDCGGSVACDSDVYGVNGLDNCCKTHDCCYATRNSSYPDCLCDQALCDCSQAAPFAWNKAVVQSVMCFVCQIKLMESGVFTLILQ